MTNLQNIANFSNIDTMMAAELDKRMSIGSEHSIIPSSIFTANLPTSSANTESSGLPHSMGSETHDRRGSFDTNAKIGSRAHPNDHHYLKSPAFLNSVQEFRHPFDTSRDALPLSQPSSLQHPIHSTFDNLVSPLALHQDSFSESNNVLFSPPLSNDIALLQNSNEYTFQFPTMRKTSRQNSTSLGLFPNIEELQSENENEEHALGNQSAFADVWNGAADAGSFNKYQRNNYNWSSPPLPEFQPLRRYSYDASTAATFMPRKTNFETADLDRFNYPNGYAHISSSNNNNNNNNNNNDSNSNIGNNGFGNFDANFHSHQTQLNGQGMRHASLGGVNLYQSNMNEMNPVSMTLSPTKEQILQSISRVSSYIGTPTDETLDIETYFDYLNNSSLPQYTIPADVASLSNCEFLACCFKNSRIDVFYVSPINKQLLGNLKIGDLVIVEADRGRDLGKVVKLNISLLETRLLRYAQYLGRKAALSKDEEQHKRPILNFPKPVLRYARDEELLTVDSKINDEVKAVAVCQHKVREYGLNMTVVDAEYQWDLKKLTFYYKSEVRIDFRDLVKELFRIYKIRIWMSKQGDIC